MSATEAQRSIDEHFSRVAPLWQELYSRNDVFSIIHRERRDIAVELIESQRLESGSHVLDVGCGAGVLTIELARRRFVIEALDSVPAMVELTDKAAEAAGVSSRVHVVEGNAHQLTFETGTFDGVAAMGVTPFLHSLPEALAEMSRVLKPGGLLVVNSDNCWRLSHLLDPLVSPVFAWLRAAVKWFLTLIRLRKASQESSLVHMYSNRQFDRLLRDAGFEVVETRALGFGPFTLFQRKLLPDRLGVSVHRFLQDLAEKRLSILRTFSTQHVVLARKLSAPESKS